MMQVYEVWNLYTGTHTYFNGKPSVEQLQELFENLSYNDALIILNEHRLIDETVGNTVAILDSLDLIDGKHEQGD